MHFIKEIFLGKQISEGTHQKFTRYGRGSYDGPSISIKKSGPDIIKVEGSIDYVGLLEEIILKNNPKRNFSYSGKIFSKEGDKKGIIEDFGIEIKKSSKKLGSFICELKAGVVSSDKLLNLYEKLCCDSYVLMNLNSMKDKKKWNLKVKKKLQKPGPVDERFFSATLGVSAFPDIIEDIAFDIKEVKEEEDNLKELKISHTYMIQELIIPEEYKNNFKEARIHAKRKGKIKRVLEVDGVKEEKEVEMLV